MADQIEVLAERILNASGSSLRHYTMVSTREAILEAVRGAYMAGWIAFGEQMKKELGAAAIGREVGDGRAT